MGILQIAADLMDSAMINERLNMGEVVGGTMEPFPIQISHWPMKPFDLTYWGCLYLKERRNYKIFCKCIENWHFSKFRIIFKKEKVIFSIFQNPKGCFWYSNRRVNIICYIISIIRVKYG